MAILKYIQKNTKKLQLYVFIAYFFMPVANVYAQNNNQQPNLTNNIIMKNDSISNVKKYIKNDFNQKYNNEIGFGEDSFIGSNETAFSINAAEGNYLVKLSITTNKKNINTIIFSEDRRVMTQPLEIKKNKKTNIEFYVNTKTPIISYAEQDKSNQPSVGLRGDENISRNWDNKITIAASNKDIIFESLEIIPSSVGKILLAGDSTVADQAGGDYASWGQFIPQNINNKTIINHARSGETLKSFLFSLRWDKLLSQIQKGDIVLIQFGHNDEKAQWPRTYVSYNGSYPRYLAAFATDVIERGGRPVIISPVARLRLGANGVNQNTHEGYDKAAQKTAIEMNIPFIDLTDISTKLYEELGAQNAIFAFADNGKDKTHHNFYGANLLANIITYKLAEFYPDEILPTSQKLPYNFNQDEFNKIKELWPNMRPIKNENIGHEPIVKPSITKTK